MDQDEDPDYNFEDHSLKDIDPDYWRYLTEMVMILPEVGDADFELPPCI